MSYVGKYLNLVIQKDNIKSKQKIEKIVKFIFYLFELKELN